MYRFLLGRVQSAPHYLLANVYPTTLYVAVAKPQNDEDWGPLRKFLESDLQQALDDGWISTDEFAERSERLRVRQPWLDST